MEIVNKVLAFLTTAHVQSWVVTLLVCIEAFLGKTDLVKSGSTLELVFNSVKKILEFLKKILPGGSDQSGA